MIVKKQKTSFIPLLFLLIALIAPVFCWFGNPTSLQSALIRNTVSTLGLLAWLLCFVLTPYSTSQRKNIHAPQYFLGIILATTLFSIAALLLNNAFPYFASQLEQTSFLNAMPHRWIP